MENLDRAPVAVLTDQGVTLGWRMLGLDQDSIGFHVIRDGVQLTVDPIRNSTMYVDPAGTASSKYVIKAVGNGNGQDKLTEEFAPLAQNYLAIKLDKPADGVTKDGKPYTYSANDASVADLDGDGKYEIIQTWARPTPRTTRSPATPAMCTWTPTGWTAPSCGGSTSAATSAPARTTRSCWPTTSTATARPKCR